MIQLSPLIQDWVNRHKYGTQSLYVLYPAQISIPDATSPCKSQGLHTNPIRSLCFLTTLSLWFFQTFVRWCFHFPSSAFEFLWIHSLRPTSNGTSSRKPSVMSSFHLLYPHLKDLVIPSFHFFSQAALLQHVWHYIVSLLLCVPSQILSSLGPKLIS